MKWIVWLLVIGALYFAYQVGMFNSIYDYVVDSISTASKEKVIQEEDGSVTTVRYKNIFDLFSKK
jgi:diacylglycerol kinase